MTRCPYCGSVFLQHHCTIDDWAVRRPPPSRSRCPDDGRCHHDCGAGPCFRVRYCGPLTGVYRDDVWPDYVILTEQVRAARLDRAQLEQQR